MALDASSSTQTATCFLLLKPKGETQPSMIDNDSAAGLAFNDALRSVAELDSFSSRPYGSDARGCSYQLFGWTNEPDDSVSGGRFLWAINFENVDSLNTWRHSENFNQTILTLSPYFDTSKFDSVTTEDMLLVEWREGDAAKLLNRVNQLHELRVGQPTGANSVNGDRAEGVTIPFDSKDQHQSMSALLNSGDPSADAAEDTAASVKRYRFTLTRTKYCTRIRQDLYNAIKSRRVE